MIRTSGSFAFRSNLQYGLDIRNGLQCLFCGETFRIGPNGGILYNHQELDACPYCLAYAAQPQLPTWVTNYAKKGAR